MTWFCSTLRLLILLCPWTADAMKHSFHTATSKTLIGPVGVPFGFNAHGHFKLTVLGFELFAKDDSVLDQVEAGFLLQRFDNEAAFNQYMEVLKSNSTLCAFDYWRDDDVAIDDVYSDPLGMDDDFGAGGEILSAEHGIFQSMKSRTKTWKPQRPTIEYQFKPGEEGYYFLIYQVCPHHEHILSRFNLVFHFYNTDRFGNISYLSAGEMKLPSMFFFFSISYLLCFILWYTNIRRIQTGQPSLFSDAGERPVVYAIHQLMSLLLSLKVLSVFFECVKFYVTKNSGHAELWSFAYYAISFVKGFFLFAVVLLIGTGWSFVKPFLNAREKKIILAVLVLQVINNIAIIVLSQETEGETSYARWSGLLHIVDILCCCAVLVPIVWQVNELEKSVGVDDELTDLSEREEALEASDKGHILSKLKLFRAFYLVVVAYIYSTRILVYLFATLLDYRHLWVRYFVVETVTLAFYVTVGLMFRPMGEDYSGVRNDDRDVEEVELLSQNDAKTS